MLRLMVSQSVSFGMKHPSGAYDQIFLTVRQLGDCCRGALPLMRRRVCRLHSRLPFSLPPTTRSATVGLFDPASTRDIPEFTNELPWIRVDVPSASLWIKNPSLVYDQNFITVRQLWVCWFGALSLTRRQVCHVQLLPAVASAVILGSESLGTCNHILLSQIRALPFHHHLWLNRYGGGTLPHFHMGGLVIRFLWIHEWTPFL
jgi:hypothetical protein